MVKGKKMFFGVVLGLILLVPNCTVLAVEEGSIATGSVCAKSVNVSKSYAALTISDAGIANVVAGVIGKAGTTNIMMTVKLQKYDSTSKKWSNVKIWEKSSSNASALLSKSYSLSKSGKYRCKMTATVTCKGKKETVSCESSNINW